jgi:glycerol-3-phosphate dehydrogenase
VQKREQLLDGLKGSWDVIVIGGGITGAGILREASVRGLKALLLEQKDFGWGTSSRSGKLVHGGLRYLRQGQVGTTWHSVREREKLLREYGGLVEGLGFLLPSYSADRLGTMLLGLGLTVYDLLALKRSRCRYSAGDVELLAPALKSGGLAGGFWYRDARTDDARLVLRVIREGVRTGGQALNYARVLDVCRGRGGRVQGVVFQDEVSGKTFDVRGQVVINATGVWADQVRSMLGAAPRLRRLRGSHLVFPRWRFPLALAVSFPHPEDGRPVYIFPWEDSTLMGTTDLDHGYPLDREPSITPQEGNYLLEGARRFFPSLDLSRADVVSTFAGVRPVLNTGKKDPSRESRDHVVWDDNGMITITGGKLTTFNLLARQALDRAARYISGSRVPRAGHKGRGEILINLPGDDREEEALRLAGRYGPEAAALVEEAGAGDLKPLPGTAILKAELRWAARHESVVHLDDLFIRRVRLGILSPRGGAALLDGLAADLRLDLGWDNGRWEEEVSRYTSIWQQAYSPELIMG